jgi:hypothetical protein
VSTSFRFILALSFVTLSGCGSQFDGTWLFQWSRSSSNTQSTCDLAEEGTQYRGDEYAWMDIYTTTGGALVVTDGEQEYVGTFSGDGFEVEATYGEQSSSEYSSWSDTVEGSLDGKDLSGTRTFQLIEGDAGSECRTQTTMDYKGVKMISGGDRPSRTIGTQSSQSASSN